VRLVNIPLDAYIPMEKVTQYLLLPRTRNDKSKFLSQAGFDEANPQTLLKAIRDHVTAHQAIVDGDNGYGEFFRVEGSLLGPNGTTLQIVTIWIRWHIDGSTHFVTLKPLRRHGA